MAQWFDGHISSAHEETFAWFWFLAIHLIFNSFHTSQGSNVQRPESALTNSILPSWQYSLDPNWLIFQRCYEFQIKFRSITALARGELATAIAFYSTLSFVIAPIFIYSIGVNELHGFQGSGFRGSWQLLVMESYTPRSNFMTIPADCFFHGCV